MSTKSSGSLIDKINCYLHIVAKDAHSTAFVPLADAFRQIGLLDDALTAARLGTEALPNFSPSFAVMGRILGQMGRLDEALSAYEKALSIDRQSLSALVGLARLHFIRGERELARQVLQTAAEFHPEDEMVANMLLAIDLPRPWFPSATDVSRQTEVAVAVADTEELGAAASAPIPTMTLAEIYIKQGLIDQAAKVYQQILQQDPGNAGVLARLEALRSPAVPEAEAEPIAEVASPAAQIATAPASASPREPLTVFEGWLEAISLRRAHVR